MGVHKLWEILEPSSKPVRLESLEDQRLAVDASIWLYQFLTAVRDVEGNSIQHAHLTGFFRRICKLLYFGIKPVFVFDGAVSPLKKDTIKKRNEKRQGKRDDAAKTAKKLLAIQMQQKLADKGGKLTPKKNQTLLTNKTPKHDNKDEWELPEIEEFIYHKSDGRLSSVEEYQDVLNQIDDELSNVDLDSINPASKEFEKLPATTQYMILYALRKKSRLRMGYSKEQLEEKFADSMDFSKFQIDMVKRRNFFTQKLLDSTGLHGQSHLTTGKIAGEKNKEYQLLKTNTGWALSLNQDDGSSLNKAIKLDEERLNDNDPDDDVDWEEVDVENAVKKEVIPDYSIKASLLSSGGKTVDQGSQAFLDKRNDSPKTGSYFSPLKRTVEYIDDDDDDDDDFTTAKKITTNSEPKSRFVPTTNGLQSHREIHKPENKPISIDDGQDSEEGDFETLAKEVRQMKEVAADNYKKKNKINLYDELKNDLGPVTVENNKSLKSPKTKPTTHFEVNDLFTSETDSKISVEENPSPQELLQNESSENRKPKVLHPSPEWFKTAPIMSNTQNIQHDNIFSEESNDLEEIEKQKKQKEVLKPKAALDFSQLEDSDVEEVDFEDVTGSPTQDPKTREIDDTSKQELGIFGFESQPSVENTEMENQDSVSLPAESVDIYEPIFLDDEEKDLKEQLQEEENDFNTFLKPKIVDNADMTFIDNGEPEDYTELLEQNRKEKRDADEVTTSMINEVKELLACFGIPYITAPMEAEAQCAELLKLKLVDGIVTDDSDIFLFGGDSVYRKMFQEKNYVEFYDQANLTAKLGLTRHNLIELAHLLGSDYTEGVRSIGPVSAIEVLAKFGGLENFRDWYNEKQFDSDKLNEEKGFQKTLRKKLVSNQVFLDSQNFPNPRVTDAYMYPAVDQDKTKFVWGHPDLGQLRSLLKGYAGWTQEKTDQVLIPLIRDINKRQKEKKQRKVTSFFQKTHSQASLPVFGVGKRMQSAMSELKKNNKDRK